MAQSPVDDAPREVAAPTATAPGKRRRQSSQTRWTDQENLELIKLVSVGGKNWGKIAELLGSGRSAGSVEQHWYIMKRQQRTSPAAAVPTGSGAATVASAEPNGSAVLFSAAQALLGIETQDSKGSPSAATPAAVLAVPPVAKDPATLVQIDQLKQRYKQRAGTLPRGRLSNDITWLTNRLATLEAEQGSHSAEGIPATAPAKLEMTSLGQGAPPSSVAAVEGGAVENHASAAGATVVGRRPGQNDIFAAKEMEQLWQRKLADGGDPPTLGASSGGASDSAPRGLIAATTGSSLRTCRTSATTTDSDDNGGGGDDSHADAEEDEAGRAQTDGNSNNDAAGQLPPAKRRNKLRNACKSCGSTSHFRKSHWSCPFNVKNKKLGESTTADPTAATASETGGNAVGSPVPGAHVASVKSGVGLGSAEIIARLQRKHVQTVGLGGDGWTVQWSDKYQESFWWHPAIRQASWIHPALGKFPDGSLPAQLPPPPPHPHPQQQQQVQLAGGGKEDSEQEGGEEEARSLKRVRRADDDESEVSAAALSSSCHPLVGLAWDGDTGKWRDPARTGASSAAAPQLVVA